MAAKTLPPPASFIQLSLVLIVIAVAVYGAAFIGAEAHRFISELAQEVRALIP